MIKKILLATSLVVSLSAYEIMIDESLSSKEMRAISNMLISKSIDKGSYIQPAMVKIKAGSFMMGSNSGDDDEKPIHKVSIKKDFYIGKYEVTVGEFRKFIDATKYKTDADKKGSCWTYTTKWEQKSGANWKNPGFSQTNNSPAVCISWNDSKKYTKWLSKKTGEAYRLPTEAEWEYVARAGTTTKYSFGDSDYSLGSYAWYTKNSYDKGSSSPDYGTHPAGLKKPNPQGIYDMYGNVWEWCEDWYIDNYENTPRDGSAYNNKTSYKVLRGGSWNNSSGFLRSANRGRGDPGNSNYGGGFRLLREL